MKSLKPFLGLFVLFVSIFFAVPAFAVAPQGTNLSAAETYTEDTPLNLIDIVASDVDSATVTATLTLSSTTVGTLSTGTSGAATSTYNAGTGVWTVSGAIADVNTLLAGVIFIPTTNGNSSFTIGASISDGTSSVTGTKAVTGIAVNDPPTATNLSAPETYTQNTNLNLLDIVAADIDSATITATLTLSNTAAGSLSTGTSGAVTSTYVAGTGVWTASGPIANVNTLLAGVTYIPASGFHSNFIIATSVTDGIASALTGSKSMTGVAAANNAPVLDSSRTPIFSAVLEDAGAPVGAVGNLVSSFVDFSVPAGQLDNVSDTDSGASLGIAITAVDSSLNCYYSLNSGATWSTIGSVSASAARLLAANGSNRIYCMGAPDANGSVTSAITFRAWDQTSGSDGSTADTSTSGGTTAFSTATDTVSLSIVPVNDAPVLDSSKSPALVSVNQGSSAPSGAVGTVVSSLVDSAAIAGGLDNATDADSSALLGIAVTGINASNLTCYYSINSGTTWTVFGAVSDTSARLLAASPTSRIYCQPSALFFGTVSNAITFRAWDQTSGSDGSTADTSTSGGATAFSTATDTASIVVAASSNTAPVATDDAYTTDEDTIAALSVLINDTDVDGDTLTVSAVTTPNHGVAIITNGGTKVSYTPDPDFNGIDIFDYTVSDGNGGTSTATVRLTVAPINDAPIATDDSYTLAKNSTATAFDVVSNDTDVDGDLLAIVFVNSPDHGGSASIQGNNILYTPAADFVGTETFSYTISDGSGGTDSGTISVDVTFTDTTPPDTTITRIGSTDITNDTATFILTSDETVTFECGLGTYSASTTFSPCPSSYTTPVLADDTYSLRVRAIDASSNTDPTPAVYSWTVSTASVTSENPANGAVGVSVNPSIIFTFSRSVPEQVRNALILSAGPCGSTCPTFTGVWSNNYTTVTYTNQAGPLEQNTTYTIGLSALVDGNTVSYYTGTFTTIAPVVVVGGSSSGKGTPWKSTAEPVSVANTNTQALVKTPYRFLRTLRQGLKGDDVIVLQKFLNIVPVPSKHFGIKTRTAVIAYQKSHGLAGDGILGAKSRALIETELNK